MTDVHTHLRDKTLAVRQLVIGEDFLGLHPWEAQGWTKDYAEGLDKALSANPALGVGEIGLDRLKTREISACQREAFLGQLRLAAFYHRPVVLHGAKCWGEVVKLLQPFAAEIPVMLFHGFSRSAGLLVEIDRLDGLISVGAAVMNDHAVNYRELVKAIPLSRLVLETDRTSENSSSIPPLGEIAAAVAKLKGIALAELEALTDANARRLYAF